MYSLTHTYIHTYIHLIIHPTHTDTAVAALTDPEAASGLLVGRHIASHKGKAHVLSERCRQVLSRAYEEGLLDPYYTLTPPTWAAAPAPSPAPASVPSLLQPPASGSPHQPPLLSAAVPAGDGGMKRKQGLLRPPGMLLKPPQPPLATGAAPQEQQEKGEA